MGNATARKEHSIRRGPVLRGSMALPFTVMTGQSKVSAFLQENSDVKQKLLNQVSALPTSLGGVQTFKTIVFFSQVLCLNSSEPPPTLPRSAGLAADRPCGHDMTLGCPRRAASPQSAGLPAARATLRARLALRAGLSGSLFNLQQTSRPKGAEVENDPGQAVKAPRDTRLLSFPAS